MFLKQCYISNFGKIHDFTYDFTDGLNLICENNGWGKSTFAAFIRSIFYGMSSGNSRTKLEDAERRKYTPWQGGEFGGFVIFEANGKEYKAERFFGSKESEDTFRLTDVKTHLESRDYSSELGKELFGIDKEAYSRSTFFPQSKISENGMNDSISAKLGRIADGEEEGNRYDMACGILDELRKQYVPDRKKEEKGLLAELNREITQAQVRLDELLTNRENAKPWREKEKECEEQIAQYKKQRTLLRERMKVAVKSEVTSEKRKHYEDLCEEENRKLRQKELMEGLFQEGVPESAVLEECEKKSEELAMLTGETGSYSLSEEEKTAYNRMKKSFGDNVPDKDEVHKKKERESELREKREFLKSEYEKVEKKKSASSTRLLVQLFCFIFCLGIAVVLFFLVKSMKNTDRNTLQKQSTATEAAISVDELDAQRNLESRQKLELTCTIIMAVLAVLAAVAAVLILINIFTRKEIKTQKKMYRSKIQQMEEEQSEMKKWLESFGITSKNLAEGYLILENRILEYVHLKSLMERKNRSEQKKEEVISASEKLLSENGIETDDISTGLRVLAKRCRDIKRVKDEYEEAQNRRMEFERENPPESLNEPPVEEDNTAWEEKEAELNEVIAQMEDQANEFRHKAEDFEEDAEEITEIEEKIFALKEQMELKKRDYGIIIETMNYLQLARDRFSCHYRTELEENFRKRVKELSENTTDSATAKLLEGIVFDADLQMKATVYGKEKELGFLSAGTQDLIFLCMRFALVDTLFDMEQPFLVLDDPFVNLDKDKIERALSVLERAAGKYQILYFTCHESRMY